MNHERKRADVPIPGTTKVVAGMHHRLVVWARTGSRDWRDRWHQLVKRLGVQWSLVSDRPETGWKYTDDDGDEVPARELPTAVDHGHAGHDGLAAWESPYEVWGRPEALQELALGCHKVVVRWEFCQRTAYEPGGTIGPEKRTMKHKSKAKVHDNFYGLDRQLAGHRGRYQKEFADAALPQSKGEDGFVSK